MQDDRLSDPVLKLVQRGYSKNQATRMVQGVPEALLTKMQASEPAEVERLAQEGMADNKASIDEDGAQKTND